jgi:hypothetical protein
MIIVMLMVHDEVLLKEISIKSSSVLLIKGFLSNDDDHHLSANVAY